MEVSVEDGGFAWRSRVTLQASFPLDVVAFLKHFPGTPNGCQPKEPGFVSKDNVSGTELAAGRYNQAEAMADKGLYSR